MTHDALKPNAESSLSARLIEQALALGFDAAGIAPAVAPPGYSRFLDWLRHGRAAGMSYLHRGAEARSHPSSLLDGVRSLVVVMLSYGNRSDEGYEPDNRPVGKIARYARGGDYHELFWRRLERLLDWVRQERPNARGRAVCDSAPLLERDFAVLAGLGWIGKNTLLIDRRLGSYTLLGTLLLDIELEPSDPHRAFHCGTCTRCLDACPTDAFVGPFELDANRCLSYWTIEHRGAIPEEIAGSLEGWAFGCDICQEVCPWNRKAPPGGDSDLMPRPEWTEPDLLAWLSADPAQFRAMLKGTALSRARRAGLLRNAALVLGQQQIEEAVPALIAAFDDDERVVREAAAWALARIGTPAALEGLKVQANDPGPGGRVGVSDRVSHGSSPFRTTSSGWRAALGDGPPGRSE